MCVGQQDDLGPITACEIGSEEFWGDFSEKKLLKILVIYHRNIGKKT